MNLIKKALFIIAISISSQLNAQEEEFVEYFLESEDLYNEYLQKYDTYNGMESIYLKQVGKEIETAFERMFVAHQAQELLVLFDWEYKVINTNDGSMEFMVFPGGKVLISRAMLNVFDTAAELAWLIAHGLGHVMYDSTVLTISKFNLEDKFNFSDEEEVFVDEFSLRLMAVAGYNPDEVIEIWKDKQFKKNTNFFDFHPKYEGRMTKIKEFAADAKANARSYGISRF